jgi:hypothetical protein
MGRRAPAMTTTEARVSVLTVIPESLEADLVTWPPVACHGCGRAACIFRAVPQRGGLDGHRLLCVECWP